MDTDTAWKNNLSAKPVEPAAKDYVYEFVMCKKGVRLKKYKGKNAYVRIPEIYKGIFRLPQSCFRFDTRQRYNDRRKCICRTLSTT